MYRSTDNGLNWENIIINDFNRCVLIKESGDVLVGSTPGILFSSDFGENWTNISFPFPGVREIEVDMHSKLFFGTYANGLFEVDLITKVEEAEDQFLREYALYQNYPNPFNSSTTIKYTIPASSDVILKIYNLLGEEILVEYFERQSAGVYELNFDANNLPSGIYFYKVETIEYSETKKMILLR